MQDKKVKYVEIDLQLVGGGLVNYGGRDLKWALRQCANFYQSAETTKNNNVLYANSTFKANHDFDDSKDASPDNRPLLREVIISSNCLRNMAFGDMTKNFSQAYLASFKYQHMIQCASLNGIVRGMMLQSRDKDGVFTKPSALYLPHALLTSGQQLFAVVGTFASRNDRIDPEMVEDTPSSELDDQNIDVIPDEKDDDEKEEKDEKKKSNTLYFYETISGKAEWSVKGGILDISKLETMYFDDHARHRTLRKEWFDTNKTEFQQVFEQLHGRIPYKVGYWNLVEAKNAHDFYALEGIKFDNDFVVELVKETLRRLVNISYVRNRGRVKTEKVIFRLCGDGFQEEYEITPQDADEKLNTLSFEVFDFYKEVDGANVKKMWDESADSNKK